MTVTAVLASLIPILCESGIGSDAMKPIAAPIVGGMITSTIHVLISVPVFFTVIKRDGFASWHTTAERNTILRTTFVTMDALTRQDLRAITITALRQIDPISQSRRTARGFNPRGRAL